MKNFLLRTFVVCILILPVVGEAQSDTEGALSVYRYATEAITPNPVVPTIYEYRLPETIAVEDVMVYSTTKAKPVYSQLQHKIDTVPVPMTIQADAQGVTTALNDRDYETTVQFDVPSDGRGVVGITYEADETFTTNALHLALAPYVDRPDSVAVYAEIDGEQQVLLAPTRGYGYGTKITFPETTARIWQVYFTYTQPLRIAEASFVPNDPKKINQQTIWFLAQPNETYTLYADAKSPNNLPKPERIQLTDDETIVQVMQPLALMPNPLYIPVDNDGDGVVDEKDNCAHVYNPEQIDLDDNGHGDACEDFDRDGHINSEDNCPNDPNRRQRDEDGDGIGDVCDSEESRLTEKHQWLPWAGLGFALLVLATMFTVVLRGRQAFPQGPSEEDRQ